MKAISSVVIASILAAVISPISAAGDQGSGPPTDGVAVLSWANIQSPASVTGPRSTLVIFYDAFRFANVSLGTAINAIPEPDILQSAISLAKSMNVSNVPSIGSAAASSAPNAAPNNAPAPQGGQNYVATTRVQYTPSLAYRDFVNQLLSQLNATPDLKKEIKETCNWPSSSTIQLAKYNAYACFILAMQLEANRFGDSFACSTNVSNRVYNDTFEVIGDADRKLQMVQGQLSVAQVTEVISDAISKVKIEVASKNLRPERLGVDRPPENVDCDIDKPLAPQTQVSVPTVQQVEQMRESQQSLALSLEREPLEGSQQLPKDQVKSLSDRLAAIDFTPYLADGKARTDFLAVLLPAIKLVKAVADIIADRNPVDRFYIVTDASSCPRGSARSTVQLIATDRLNPSTQAQTYPIVTITCYPKSYVALGGGYSQLPVNTFANQQHDYVVNHGGPPPSPAPTFQPIFSVEETSSPGREYGAAFVHTCLCAFPGDKWNAYWSAGVGISNQTPQLLYGITFAHARNAFLTVGGATGFVTTLNGGNSPGEIVSPTYVPSTARTVQTRWNFSVSFPVLDATPAQTTTTPTQATSATPTQATGTTPTAPDTSTTPGSSTKPPGRDR